MSRHLIVVEVDLKKGTGPVPKAQALDEIAAQITRDVFENYCMGTPGGYDGPTTASVGATVITLPKPEALVRKALKG